MEVLARHSPEGSKQLQSEWLFEYTVRITNLGTVPVQLVSRHWIITDALDHTREVRGEGVVGKQPILAPGESFQYSSWCPIPTPTGMMQGVYQMSRAEQEKLEQQAKSMGAGGLARAKIGPDGAWTQSPLAKSVTPEFARAVNAATGAAEGDLLLFQFGKAAESLYHFPWDDFCDWYVELAKVQLAGDGAEATRVVLGHVLDVLLRRLHPTIPFVTDELWTALTGRESVVVAPWPAAPAGAGVDERAAARIAGLQRLVTEIRRFRSDQGLNPKQRVAARLSNLDACELSGHEAAVRSLVRLDEPAVDFAPTVSFEIGLPTGTVTVELDTSEAIDVVAERARLDKDLAVARKELSGTEAKLGNPKFTERAPADVVDKIKARQTAAAAEIERIEARLAALPVP